MPGSGGGSAGTRRRLHLQGPPRKGRSLLELIEILARIMEAESQPVHTDPRPGDVRHTCADPSAARRSWIRVPGELRLRAAPDNRLVRFAIAQAMKYFASGWGTMIADVLCSGTRWYSSVSVTPMRSMSSSSATLVWSSRSGHAG